MLPSKARNCRRLTIGDLARVEGKGNISANVSLAPQCLRRNRWSSSPFPMGVPDRRDHGRSNEEEPAYNFRSAESVMPRRHHVRIYLKIDAGTSRSKPRSNVQEQPYD